jgi:hypothetical protein
MNDYAERSNADLRAILVNAGHVLSGKAETVAADNGQ